MATMAAEASTAASGRAAAAWTQQTAVMGNQIPGLESVDCPVSPILPLSDIETTITTAIDGMKADGWTYIPAGLAWGWRTLSPHAPFAEAMNTATFDDKGGTRAIILMTDGMNTRAPDYPTHESIDTALADTKTADLCVAIKAQNIVVYTIAFDVTDTTIKSILETCATKPTYYFTPTDTTGLKNAFKSIAESVRNLSIVQ